MNLSEAELSCYNDSNNSCLTLFLFSVMLFLFFLKFMCERLFFLLSWLKFSTSCHNLKILECHSDWNEILFVLVTVSTMYHLRVESQWNLISSQQTETSVQYDQNWRWSVDHCFLDRFSCRSMHYNECYIHRL